MSSDEPVAAPRYEPLPPPSGAGAGRPPAVPPASPPVDQPIAPPLAPPAGPLRPAAPPIRTAPWSPPGGAPPTGEPPVLGGSAAGPPPEPPAPRRGGHLRTALLAALIGAIVAGGVTAAALWDRGDTRVLQGSPVNTPSRPAATIAGEELDIQQLLDKVRPSVVSIHTGVRGGEAAGSGIVLTAEGTVLTNAHVVEGAQTIEIDFADGSTAEGRLLGADASADVAVIQADGLAQPVTPAELGTSDDLQVGDDVVAIGNALNLGEDPSVTTGIVSALNRSITAPSGEVLDGLIQTDAAINPGNSGGPLVNSRGQVVGVNTAILADAQNIGFALSIDSVRDKIDPLKAGQQPETVRAVLGVSTVDVATLDPAVVSRFGIVATSGAFVQKVETGSGADLAGLEVGDVITSVDGRRVRTSSDVGTIIRSKQPGDVVAIEVERSGRPQPTTATLGTG